MIGLMFTNQPSEKETRGTNYREGTALLNY